METTGLESKDVLAAQESFLCEVSASCSCFRSMLASTRGWLRPHEGMAAVPSWEPIWTGQVFRLWNPVHQGPQRDLPWPEILMKQANRRKRPSLLSLCFPAEFAGREDGCNKSDRLCSVVYVSPVPSLIPVQRNKNKDTCAIHATRKHISNNLLLLLM